MANDMILPFLRRADYWQRLEVSKSTDLANRRDKSLKRGFRRCGITKLPTDRKHKLRSTELRRRTRTLRQFRPSGGSLRVSGNAAKAKPHSAATASQPCARSSSWSLSLCPVVPRRSSLTLTLHTPHGIHKWWPGPIVSADGPANAGRRIMRSAPRVGPVLWRKGQKSNLRR